MSKRYGGKFSPDAKPASGARIDRSAVDPAGARANIMFVPAIPLVFTALNDGPVALATALVSAATLTLSAWLLRDGLRAEAAYNARKMARRPALPRKMLSSALAGIGVAGAALSGDTGLLGSILYGLCAAGLHVAAFGIDPLVNKRVEGVDTFQQDRVSRVVEEAESHLSVIRTQIEALSDRPLLIRVNAFIETARDMIKAIEDDPRDLTGARKFLGVYLMGARDATVKFVDLYRRRHDADAKESYERLLGDLEQNFAAKTERLLLNDRSDMDIEIKVLRDRLQREGVSLK